MIQDLPNADKCRNYVWQEFEVMQERTAAGVAAAAQKKLENLVKMGSANKKPPGSAPGRARKAKSSKNAAAATTPSQSQAQSPDDLPQSTESPPQLALSSAPLETVVLQAKSESPNNGPSPTEYTAIKVAALQVPDNRATAN